MHKELLPGCSILPTHGDTVQLAEEILAGEVDAALVTLPLKHPDLRVETLRRDRSKDQERASSWPSEIRESRAFDSAAVRETMYELSGTRPEPLPPDGDIKEVHKGLKKTHREFKKLDKQKDKKLPPA